MNKKIKTGKNQLTHRGEEAQLLLLGGIAICLAIITLAMISVNLSSISSPIDKSLFIKPEYDNIRKEFGVALSERLNGKLDYGENLIRLNFNYTRDTFIFLIESLKGNSFDAKYAGLTYSPDGVDGIRVILTLSNSYEYVNEEVEYDFR